MGEWVAADRMMVSGDEQPVDPALAQQGRRLFQHREFGALGVAVQDGQVLDAVGCHQGGNIEATEWQRARILGIEVLDAARRVADEALHELGVDLVEGQVGLTDRDMGRVRLQQQGTAAGGGAQVSGVSTDETD